jgi:insertion element IS1 protein InsB
MLWKKLKNKDIGEVMTDHWKAYAEFIPKNIHTRSKAETYTVEGYIVYSGTFWQD